MNIVNERIEHIVYGEGMVISQEDGRLSVKFSEKYGIRQFVYPDSFVKYLKMCNSDFQISVLEDLNDKRARIEAERLQIQEVQMEADRIMLENSKLESKKKKTTIKQKK